MGHHGNRISIALVAGTLALAGCANPDGTNNQPGTGAIIGGLTGAAAGQIVGGDTRATVIGGAVGAAIGGAIGAQMQAQERELQQSLQGTGAVITYTGNDIRVILPEGVTFRTGSSVVDPSVSAGAQGGVRQPSGANPDIAWWRVVGHTDNVGTAPYNASDSARTALWPSRGC